MSTYLYRCADGVWRNRCRAHVRTTGPYRAVTDPQPSPVRVCVVCHPWGGGMAEVVAGHGSQPQPVAPAAADTDEIRLRARHAAAALRTMLTQGGNP